LTPPQGPTTETTGWHQAAAFNHQIIQLATDLGRLRRRLPEDGSAVYLADLIAGRVHDLHWLVWPTAAELVQHGDTPQAALATVDARSRQLAALLGEPAR
jgi:hypothetical protein